MENDDITETQRRKIVNVRTGYSDIFAADPTEVTTACNFEYEIQLKEDKLVQHKPTRMNPEQKEIATKLVKN